MAQQTKSPSKKLNKIFIFILLILLVLAVIAAFFIFRRPIANETSPIVMISFPVNGTTVEINTPTRVEAQAENFPGVKRVELYADGTLVSVQDSTLAKGGNPLVLSENWVPLTIGRHALVARAYDLKNKFSDSGIVYVDVVELLTPNTTINIDTIDHGSQITSLSVNQIAEAAGITPVSLQAANPSLGGVDPGAPLPPGTVLSVPRIPAPAPAVTGTPPLPLAGSPAAPTNLSGLISCTEALVNWSASADATGGYAVYRLGPGDSGPQKVATPGSGSTSFNQAITTPGTYRYQVAALRAGLEGLSTYFVGSTPANCASTSTNADVVSLVVSVTGIKTSQTFDGVYCYFSMDKSSYQRVPTSDFTFLIPDGSGNNYDLPKQLPNRGLFFLTAHPASQPLTLAGECWGRTGAESKQIGTLSISLPSSDWNGSERQATVLQSVKMADVSIGQVPSSSFTLTYRVASDTTASLRTLVPPFYGNIPDEALRPVLQPDLSIQNPYDLTVDFGSAPVRCTPGTDGVTCRIPSDMHLTWKYDGNRDAIGGFGYLIGTNVYTPDSGVYYGNTTSDAQGVIITDNEAIASIESVLAQDCGSSNIVGYTIYVLDHFHNKVSEAHGYFPAPQCDTQVARVSVTLDSISIGPSSAHHAILDNDTCVLCADNRMEISGRVRLNAGGNNWDAARWQGRAYNNDTDAYLVVFALPIYLGQQLFTDTCENDFASCPRGPAATTSFQWADLNLKTTNGVIGQNNNTIHVDVRDGHTVTLEITFNDYPTGFNTVTDPFCVATITLPWTTAAEWQSVNEQQTVIQDHGEASCQITYTVHGSTP